MALYTIHVDKRENTRLIVDKSAILRHVVLDRKRRIPHECLQVPVVNLPKALNMRNLNVQEATASQEIIIYR